MLRRFFGYYRPYKGLFLLDFTCAIIAGLLELAFPLAVSAFVEELLPSENWRLIVFASVGLLAIYAVNAVLHYIVTYWGHMLGVNIETDMRRKMFSHIQKLSFRFFDNHKTGHLIGRITNDLNDIGEVAHHGPEDAFIAVMTLAGAFAIMVNINPELAILTFLIIPLMAWLTIIFGTRMTKTYRKLFRDVGDFNARIEDNVGGIRVVQSFANEEHEKKLFAENNEQYRSTKMQAYKTMAKSITLSYIMMRLITVFVMVVGAWFFIHDKIELGDFLAFILLSNIFFRPIEKINAVIESYPKGIAGFKRYVEILDTEPDIDDRPNAIELDELHGDIVFDEVAFGYEPDRQVLKGINLTIHKGETIAFVGPSGAGKTTICSLLPRFYDVDEGRIAIDGIDIRDIKLVSLRSNIGIVQQDVFLFSGTIRENIAYGDLHATEEQIWDAARKASLADLIASLPEGMDTVIGERGVKLSGGQKQRLSIARMFLKNPPILILDEATSALDTETEAAIQRSLADLSAGRTTLVIAHRLSTIQNADRIVVIDEEGIVEMGSHEQLVSAGGVYSRLHNVQMAIH